MFHDLFSYVVFTRHHRHVDIIYGTPIFYFIFNLDRCSSKSLESFTSVLRHVVIIWKLLAEAVSEVGLGPLVLLGV